MHLLAHTAYTLLIETGRYRGIPRDQRICPLCNSNLEDEFNVGVKICKFYLSLGKKYLKQYFYRNPSVWNIVQLLSPQNTKELCNLAVFIKKAFYCEKSYSTGLGFCIPICFVFQLNIYIIVSQSMVTQY